MKNSVKQRCTQNSCAQFYFLLKFQKFKLMAVPFSINMRVHDYSSDETDLVLY